MYSYRTWSDSYNRKFIDIRRCIACWKFRLCTRHTRRLLLLLQQDLRQAVNLIRVGPAVRRRVPNQLAPNLVRYVEAHKRHGTVVDLVDDSHCEADIFLHVILVPHSLEQRRDLLRDVTKQWHLHVYREQSSTGASRCRLLRLHFQLQRTSTCTCLVR